MAFDLVRKDPDDIKGYEVADDDENALELVRVIRKLMKQGYQHCELKWARLPEGATRFQVAAAPPVGDEIVALEHHVLIVSDGNEETALTPTVTYAEADGLSEQYDTK